MKTNWIPLMLALAAGTQARGEADRPDRRPPPPVPPLIEAIDLDGDGVISGDEIADAAKSIAGLDANGDGKLTRDELRPPRPDGAPEGPPAGPPPGNGRDGKRQPPPVIAALDGDQDGELSAEEIEAAPQALLTLDQDGSGSLEREETMPKPPGRDGGGDGAGRRPQGGPPQGGPPQGGQGNRPQGPPPRGGRR